MTKPIVHAPVATGSTEPRDLRDRFADIANVKDFGAKGNTTKTFVDDENGGHWEYTYGADDTEAIQAAIATGKSVYFPAGIYIVKDELTIVTQGQHLFGDGRGFGRVHTEDVFPPHDWTDRSTLLFMEPKYHGQEENGVVQPNVRYVKTRYKVNYAYTETVEDVTGPAKRLWYDDNPDTVKNPKYNTQQICYPPCDDPISVGVNVQAEGVVIEDLCVRLWVDPAYRLWPKGITPVPESIPENALGANWDVGIFIGTRLECTLRRVAVIGYHRRANIWIDVSQGNFFPRFINHHGTQFPSHLAQSGSDGLLLEDVTTYGGLWGVRVQGGEPENPSRIGSNRRYLLCNDRAYPDTRGAYGLSDFLMVGCEIFGGAYHMGLRLKDWTQYTYTEDIEVDDSIVTVTRRLYPSGVVDIKAYPQNATPEYKAQHTVLPSAGATSVRGKTYVVRSPFKAWVSTQIDEDADTWTWVDMGVTLTDAGTDTNLATDSSYLELGGAYMISGISSNGSNRLRGHRYIGCRFASRAAFTVLINYSARDTFIGCHGEDFDVNDPYGTSHPVNARCSFGILCMTSNHMATKNVSSQMPYYNTWYEYKHQDTAIGTEYTGNYDYDVSIPGKRARLSLANPDNEGRVFFFDSLGEDIVNWWPETTPMGLRLMFSDYIFYGDKNAQGNRTNLMMLHDDGNLMTRGIVYSVNGSNLGKDGSRWNCLYAKTTDIGLSDARLKANISDPSEALMRAWGKVRFKIFQFKDSIAEKGEDAARLHMGVIAQQVQEAFASEGLDASRYGLWCYGEWPDEYEDVTVIDSPAICDDDGNVIEPAVKHTEHRLVTPAGNEYSLRYTECLCLECAYQRWRLDRLEAALGL